MADTVSNSKKRLEYTMKVDVRWRVGLAAASATLLVASLAACSSGSDGGDVDGGDGEPTTVTFSYLWGGAEAEALEAIISDFNASQDDIVVEGISSPDFQKQLTSMSASKGSFDISDHFGNAVGSWASKGILEPLDEYLAAEGVDPSVFVPAAMDQMTYDGKIYSLPIAVHSFQLMYNKALLDEAGVKVPETMDDLAAAIVALTKQDSDGTVTQLGLGDPSVSTTITTLGYAFGGNWDRDGEPSPEDDGNIAAIEWYKDNVVDVVGADNLAAFTAGVGEYNSAADPFFTGKYAMVIDGEWRAVGAQNNAQDLDWGVTSIPYVTTDLAETTQLTASTLFIPSNAQNKEEAATFLAYLVSPEAMTNFTLALGNLPGRLDLLDAEGYDAIPQFQGWLDALKSDNVFALNSAPYSAEYSTDLGTAFDDVIRGASSASDAMATVAARATNYASE